MPSTLNDKQKSAVKSSWEKMTKSDASKFGENGAAFFQTMFDTAPDVKPLFQFKDGKDARARAHGGIVFNLINMLVLAMDHKEDWDALTEKFAKQHPDKKVKDAVTGNLKNVMDVFLDKNGHGDAKEAWGAFIGDLAKTLK